MRYAPELAAIEVEHVSFEERGALLPRPGAPREHGQALVEVAAYVTSEPAICPVAALRRRVDEAAGDGGTYLFARHREVAGTSLRKPSPSGSSASRRASNRPRQASDSSPAAMVRGFCEEAFRGGATTLEVTRKARFRAVEAAERHRPINDGQHPAMLVLELAATNGD